MNNVSLKKTKKLLKKIKWLSYSSIVV
jgi:hypothetical protein